MAEEGGFQFRKFFGYECIVLCSHASYRWQIPPMTAPPARITDSGGDSSFTMFITCGPYTPDSDLLFKPWQNLMSIAAKEKPDVILLVCLHAAFYALS